MGQARHQPYDPAVYAARRAAWDADPTKRADQQRKWREAFRKRKGARPLDEIRAEQAAKREAAEAVRREKAAARALAKSMRLSTGDQHRAWVAANRERMRELLRDWKKRNPDAKREHERRRMTVDHITALANGGRHVISNIQFLCMRCNSSKGAKDPIVFAQSMGRLL